MAAKDGLTASTNFDVEAREIDFVTRFSKNWDALREILGIMRPIRKTAGTKLVSYIASAVDGLEDGAVAEGDLIPLTEFKVDPVDFQDITVKKYAKSVSIESVNKWGAEIAVQKTDDEFLVLLQNTVLSDFYTFLNTGSLTSTEASWQMALAMAKGNVLNKFATINRSVSDVVGFANILDAYKYIGGANVTVQTSFGIQYIKGFMGYSTIILLPDTYIEQGTVIATPVENINLYYIDPSDSDFAKLGLKYTTEGETNLVGFHAEGDYSRATGDSYAIMGMSLWAEYLDGIAVVTVEEPEPPAKVE